jgi:hypothetical protein
MQESLNDVVHFAPTAAAELLRELDVEHLVEFRDNLAHGPARLDPKRHREARLSYWRQMYEQLGATSVDSALTGLQDGYLSTEQFGSIGRQHAKERQLVIWTTPTLSDRLFAWMLFDAFQRADIPADRLATAEPRVATGPETDRFFALRELQLDELMGGWEELFFPVEIYVQAGANLWETYASSSPRQFAISVGHTEKFFPDIATLAQDYGQMFPSVSSDATNSGAGEEEARLELSPFDRCLLEAVDADGGATAFDVLGAECLESMLFVDDLVVAWRLNVWAEQTDLVEFADVEDGAGLFERHRYRLTETGRRWCDEGIPAEADIPLIEVGDCRVYGGPTPWARHVDELEDAWYFDRFE